MIKCKGGGDHSGACLGFSLHLDELERPEHAEWSAMRYLNP